MKKPPFNTKRKNNKSSTQVSVPRSAQIYQELTLLSAKDGRGIAGDHTHAEILPLLPRIGAIARLIPFVEIKSHNRDRDTHLSPPPFRSLDAKSPIDEKSNDSTIKKKQKRNKDIRLHVLGNKDRIKEGVFNPSRDRRSHLPVKDRPFEVEKSRVEEEYHGGFCRRSGREMKRSRRTLTMGTIITVHLAT